MKYTLRDLFADLNGFDLDAEITPLAKNGLLFEISNPTPINGECDWNLFTPDSLYNRIKEKD